MKLHVGTREFACHLCDKAYPRADTLKRHILSFHENKRLYKCDVCGKSFKGHIRDHMRTHAEDREEKPFGCSQCGARFNQRSQLTVHMRVRFSQKLAILIYTKYFFSCLGPHWWTSIFLQNLFKIIFALNSFEIAPKDAHWGETSHLQIMQKIICPIAPFEKAYAVRS